MKISNVNKVTFLGLTLLLNTCTLNACTLEGGQIVIDGSGIPDVINYCRDSSDKNNENATDSTQEIDMGTYNMQNTTIDNTSVIIDSVNNTTSTPQCQQYGAFGECLY